MSFYKKVSISFLFIICSLLTVSVFAQSDARTHFIYIQSDGQQPFYVILNKKTYSSSSVGYLIISKLTDGKYNITIGYPQEKYPAKTYICNINGTDAGYRLKKSGDNWSMLNRQTGETLEVIDGTTQTAAANNEETTQSKQNSNSGFGAMLSKTSNDTTDYQAIARAKKAAAEKALAEKAATEEANKPVQEGRVSNEVLKTKERSIAKVDNLKNKTDFKESDYADDANKDKTIVDSDVKSMIKTQERKDRRGISLEFVSTSSNTVDTINAFIPSEENTSNDTQSIVSKETTTSDNNTASTSKTNPFYKGTSDANKVVSESKPKNNANDNLAAFSDDEENKPDVKKEANTAKEETKTDGNEIFNSTCTNQLSDKDLDKIKKKMISKNSDDEMILVARKNIDTKCVYTAQIKQLGDLLLSDASRFSLYRLLYPNVYDGSQFKTLESQLLDKNYKSQFEALIKN